MRWLLVLICVLTFLASGCFGHKVGAKGQRPALALISAGLLVLALRLALPPAWEFACFSGDLYPILRPWWPIPTSLALLLAGAHHMSSQEGKRGVRIFAGLLGISALLPLLQTARVDPRSFSGFVEADGVCRQTTDFSCGAAAASTFLARIGVEADEAEMAERCWTNSMTGTDEFCVARGLRSKLREAGLEAEREVALIQTDWGGLLARGAQPSLATIRYSLLVDHWVAVFETTPTEVLVGDPLEGRRRIPKADFLEVWRRGLVIADLQPGRENEAGAQTAPLESGS